MATVPVVVKDGIASGSYVPSNVDDPRGDLYDIIVVAEGLAGKTNEEVQIFVKP